MLPVPRGKIGRSFYRNFSNPFSSFTKTIFGFEGTLVSFAKHLKLTITVMHICPKHI